MKLKFPVIAGVATAVAVTAGFYWLSSHDDHSGHQTAQRVSDGKAIVLPQLSTIALEGEVAFSENCSVCHGKHAVGTEQGPPLIHVIYEPSHHGDGSFYRAVEQGVRRHHWRFGDMPPIEGVAKEDVGKIIAYVRETQRANGIN